MIWEEFQRSAPGLAALGEERFQRTGLLILGTIRKNGWPRISPVEVLIAHGHLYLGMMWRSQKALDLLRAPRCTIHSTVSNRDGSEGDFKAYGRAVEIKSLEQRRAYCDALYEKIGWKPEEPEFHLFSINIESAAFVVFQGEKLNHQVWRAS
jgi:hypothetical protein